jgi:hypothetical protein
MSSAEVSVTFVTELVELDRKCRVDRLAGWQVVLLRIHLDNQGTHLLF